MLVGCSAAIAIAAPDLPFYYYDRPKLTGLEFDMVDFPDKAGERMPNLAGIKFTHDDLDMYSACREIEGRRFDISWGIDERFVQALGAGAKSAVGSTYTFEALLYQEASAAFELGDKIRAEELQREGLRLILERKMTMVLLANFTTDYPDFY